MKHTLTLLPILALALSSCSEKPTESNSSEANAEKTQGSQLSSILTENKPEGAIQINALRKSAKTGESVTVTGKILGASSVLIDNRAIMILGDPNFLTSCDLKEDDHCSTPWDVCCDDVDTINANIVTVQVVDEAGRPLKQGFRGIGGIKELSHITLNGTVAEGSNEKNMLVNASSLYVHPRK